LYFPVGLIVCGVDFIVYCVLYFQGLLSILMLISDDMYALINYMSFVQWLSVGMSVTGLLYLRWKKPDWERPIKVILATLTFILTTYTNSFPRLDTV